MTYEIHIVDWDRFQHYKDRWPPWIKNYTELLAHDGYLRLTGHRRAILHGLWIAYAMSHGQLTLETKKSTSKHGDDDEQDQRWSALDTASMSKRLGLVVKTSDLKALNHAGFITLRASNLLAERYQDASGVLALTRSREAEAETEAEDLRPEGSSLTENPLTPSEARPDRPPFADVLTLAGKGRGDASQEGDDLWS